MLGNSPFYAGFAVDDKARALDFYRDTLGLDVADRGGPVLSLRTGTGNEVIVYQKDGHVPAQHTVLNFPVDGLEAIVDQLTAAGVSFEHYDQGPLRTDGKGIARLREALPGMPSYAPAKQAWFRDPAGNILSIIEP